MNELADERRKNPDRTTSPRCWSTPTSARTCSRPTRSPPFFILLAVAGNDTTRTAISHGMHLLSQNPDQRQIWQDDLEGVTPTAVEEIVRVASPVTFMRRTVTNDLTLSGHDFTEGDKLVLLYGAANRDPRVFDDPERFDVLRSPNNHVGFGGPGPHFCLGAHLARRELSVAFRQLLTRLPDIELAGDPVPLEGVRHPAGRRHQAPPGAFYPDQEGGRLLGTDLSSRRSQRLRWKAGRRVRSSRCAAWRG